MPSDFLALPHRRQEQVFSCTPACARMVLAYYGNPVSEEELVELFDTSRTGTPFRAILNLTQRGYEVRLTVGTLEELRAWTSDGRPCITRIMTSHLPRYPLPPWVRHSVVVVGVSENLVYYHDPAQEFSPDQAPLSSFERAWEAGRREYAVILKP